MKSIKDRLYDKAARKRIPLTAAFELSPICNFDCKMCYVHKSASEVKESGGLMPLDFWLDMVGQAKEMGTMFPLITGGEAFVYPHLQAIYEEMIRAGMQVSFNTNGSCITEEHISWLKQTPPTRINITLYGASNESYERLCGNPHGFDQVKYCVAMLEEAGIRYKFNCSVTPYNQQDLPAIMDFAKSHDHPIRIASYMFPPIRRVGTHENFSDRLSPDEAAYWQVYVDHRQLAPEAFIRLANNLSRFVPLTPELIAEAEKQAPRTMGCLAGRCSYWIDWQGNISGCGMMDVPTISVREKSLADAWKELVDWTENQRYSAVCGNCVNSKVCYACAAMVYNECGNFQDRPEYLCSMRESAVKYYMEFAKRYPQYQEVTRLQSHPADSFVAEKIQKDNIPDLDCL